MDSTSHFLKEKAIRDSILEENMDNDIEEEEEVGVGDLAYGDDDKKKKVYGRRGYGSGGSPPRCLVERCGADLTEAKRYHKRHKVCEIHSKAPVVIVAGLRQRFCQQCSRFHELSEFDETKRSCRRRLAGHNERRRKNSTETIGEGSSQKGISPQLKDGHYRQAQISLQGNNSYKRPQYR